MILGLLLQLITNWLTGETPIAYWHSPYKRNCNSVYVEKSIVINRCLVSNASWINFIKLLLLFLLWRY